MTKPIKHIVSLSGGKDSTAMLLRMLEEGWPVDLIIFCDTGLEFDAMYRHIEKLETYVGIPITRLKADHSFEYYFLEHRPKRKNPVHLCPVLSEGFDHPVIRKLKEGTPVTNRELRQALAAFKEGNTLG